MPRVLRADEIGVAQTLAAHPSHYRRHLVCGVFGAVVVPSRKFVDVSLQRITHLRNLKKLTEDVPDWQLSSDGETATLQVAKVRQPEQTITLQISVAEPPLGETEQIELSVVELNESERFANVRSAYDAAGDIKYNNELFTLFELNRV